MIEEGEAFLKSLGFTQVRVRKHGEIARIELLPSEMGKAVQDHFVISKRLREIGFEYVALDLECFRSGSMDLQLKKEK